MNPQATHSDPLHPGPRYPEPLQLGSRHPDPERSVSRVAFPGRPPSGRASGAGARTGSGTLTVVSLFLRRLFADRAVWVLPVTAFAVVGTLALLVAGGAASFWDLAGVEEGIYVMLAVFALMLLVFPLVGLTGSAAKLLARRRDERLSSLRLLGASTLTVRTLAVVEAVVLAGAGLLLGIVGYLVAMPLVGLLHFAGRPIGVDGMWLGGGWLLAVVGALLLMAAASSMAGLRRIEITPLGVRTRQQAAKAHWIRLVLGAVGLVVAQLVLQANGAGSMMVVLILMVVGFALPMLALNLVGPWLVATVTRRSWRRAETAEKLVAARNVLESPQQAWRQIGGLAVCVYIGVVGGAGMGLATATAGTNPDEVVLMADLRTGVLLTMLIAFVLTACSVGISQAAQVLDRAAMYRGLGRLGMTEATLQEIRRRSVMGPLWIVLVFTLGAALVTTLPVIGAAIVFSPGSMALVVGVLVLGVVLVRLGVTASRPALRGVLAGR